MKIAQVMKTDVEVCGFDDNLAAAASRMWDCDIGCLPVLDAAGRSSGWSPIGTSAWPRSRAASRSRHPGLGGDGQGGPLVHARRHADRGGGDHALRPGAPVAGHRFRRRLVGIVSLNDLARLAEQEIGRKNRDLSAQEVTATLAAISAPRQVVERELPRDGGGRPVSPRCRPLARRGKGAVLMRRTHGWP